MAPFTSPLSYKDRKNTKLYRIRLAIILFVIFTIYLMATGLLISTFIIESSSMSPGIERKDKVLYHPNPNYENLDRGDVILVQPSYYKPNSGFVRLVNLFIRFITFQNMEITSWERRGWEKPFHSKRIIALAGDSIYMEDFVVYVRPANEEFFLSEFETSERVYDIHIPREALWDHPLIDGNMEEIVLNPGEVFVLGDNRGHSSDSLYWGILDEDRVVGKVLMTYWPVTHGKIH